ncbi:hypothetical protein IWW34DRAFT_773636 [Fusarium oxysporum f. sp. albedinis]|nr:hypothetical protein IWW34DRAFT_773636 [Fusarium oxysporum f. sp. albedinis]
MRNLTISMCPLSDAQCNGVAPCSVVASMLAPRTKRSLKTSMCPFHDDRCSGVHPL